MRSLRGESGRGGWSRACRGRGAAWLTPTLLVVVSCGGGDQSAVVVTTATTVRATTSTPAPVTTPAPTTAAPTTAPATTETVAPTTTTGPDTRFEPPCVERPAAGRAIPADDPTLDEFAPFGAEPVVQLALPQVAPQGDVQPVVRPLVSRIPGGMLVHVLPDGAAGIPSSVLVAVDADGTVRWQRCLDPAPSLVLVGADPAPDEFVVGWVTSRPDGRMDGTYEVWSLTHGHRSRTWDEGLAANRITGAAVGHRDLQAQGDSVVVLGPSGLGADPERTLLVVDLPTMAMRVVPLPPSPGGTPAGSLLVQVADDGTLIAFDHAVPGGRAVAVERDGGWSTTAADLTAAVPVRGQFSYGETPQALTGIGADGTQRWRREDVVARSAEGFHTATLDGVVLASGCSAAPNEDDWCPGPTLIAVDAETGRTLWQRDGAWGVSVLGDGRALILRAASDSSGGSSAWSLIDVATGEQVGSTTWREPWHFGIGCCADPLGASRAGGVVFTYDERAVEMWYPASASTPMQRVDLG